MKRNLIAASAVAFALAANAAFAEPTVDVFLGQGNVVWSKAPEATSYQDAHGAMSLGRGQPLSTDLRGSLQPEGSAADFCRAYDR